MSSRMLHPDVCQPTTAYLGLSPPMMCVVHTASDNRSHAHGTSKLHLREIGETARAGERGGAHTVCSSEHRPWGGLGFGQCGLNSTRSDSVGGIEHDPAEISRGRLEPFVEILTQLTLWTSSLDVSLGESRLR